MLFNAISNNVRRIAVRVSGKNPIGKLFLNNNKITTVIDNNYALRYLCSSANRPITGAANNGTHITTAIPSEGTTATDKNAEGHTVQSTNAYIAKIKDLLKTRQLKAAIEVMEKEMIELNGLTPSENVFSLLINESGRLGYAKKSLQLYKLMTEYGIQPTAATYTALFTSCEKTPYLQDGLNTATRIRSEMLAKSFEPTEAIYELMIMSFGRCRDMDTACAILNETRLKGFTIGGDIYKYLLHAASKNEKNGFMQAITVWQTMNEHNVQIDVVSFHLMLDCISECGIGDEQSAKSIINRIIVEKRNNSINDDDAESKSAKECDDGTPNLLAKCPRFGKLIALSEVQEPEHRLLLLGGMRGFLAEFKVQNVMPTVGTFMQLLKVIPLTASAEDSLVQSMRMLGIKPDVEFYNALLKKRCLHIGYEKASETLNWIYRDRLLPTAETFRLLALCCRNINEVHDFLSDLRDNDFKSNVHILEAFIRSACKQNSLEYLDEVLTMLTESKYLANVEVFQRIDEFLVKYPKKFLINKKPSKYDVIAFNKFFRRYRRWKKEILGKSLDTLQEGDIKESEEMTRLRRKQRPKRKAKKSEKKAVDENEVADDEREEQKPKKLSKEYEIKKSEDPILQTDDSHSNRKLTKFAKNRKVKGTEYNQEPIDNQSHRKLNHLVSEKPETDTKIERHHPWQRFEQVPAVGVDINTSHRKQEKKKPRRRKSTRSSFFTDEGDKVRNKVDFSLKGKLSTRKQGHKNSPPVPVKSQ